MNVINIIYPYKSNKMWVFDDDNVGLKAEPFIAGADTLMDKATANLHLTDKEEADGFRLTFSKLPFPDYDECLVWERGEQGGNVYWSDKYEMEGWLCPALFKYFDKAPVNIYFKINSK